LRPCASAIERVKRQSIRKIQKIRRMVFEPPIEVMAKLFLRDRPEEGRVSREIAE
jgi:hypothetical protein